MWKKTGKKVFLLSIFFSFFLPLNSAWADVAIETSVSRSRLAVGEELTLDIIITGAQGKISKPTFPPVDGFSSYSQGHSQEISIINGKTSSRSVFSYILIANSEGKKTIGPFFINIEGKVFKAAPVEVEVVRDMAAAGGPASQAYSQAPVGAPPARALPGGRVTDKDIFVKAWLDKDEVHVNEPAILTYTIYTRLSATYKGFEKEPVTTGFWVEDFPPEKTIRKTEQIFGGSRYVVADVRKLALFPTQAGVFTIDPGTINAMVEVREQDDFDSFFSYNIFGRRSFYPTMMQVFSKTITTEPLTLVAKALPETGKPSSFNGAVGDYKIESSVDKTEVEEGTPVTFRVRVSGQGNINTLQTPAVSKMEDFKIYDSSSSVNISKNRLIVEGEKVTETVLVPKKAGIFALPALEFSYFEPASKSYKLLKTSPHTLKVNPAPATEIAPPAPSVEPVEKEEVAFLGKDIRYIKAGDMDRVLPVRELYKNALYWLLNGVIATLTLLLMFFGAARESALKDLKGMRFRRSHRVAKRKLKKAALFLKQDKKEEFYTEISRALDGYFADKLNIPAQMVSVEAIEEHIPQGPNQAHLAAEIKTLFEELAQGRFARIEKSHEEMKRIYEMADRVITLFERVKMR